jgi:hypothetical protein
LLEDDLHHWKMKWVWFHCFVESQQCSTKLHERRDGITSNYNEVAFWRWWSHFCAV